jgi:hypothetical protein
MKKEVSYLQIQSNLAKFSVRWKDYKKNEKTGAQTFLNEFFECFGISFDPNRLPYEFNTGAGFADCYIKGKLVIEMKDSNKVKSKDDLIKVLPQAEKYWRAEKKEANYLVLCNFNSFIILDTRDNTKTFFKLSEIDKKFNSFSFLFSSSSFLVEEQEAVSKNATQIMGKLYKSLSNRLSKKRQDEVDTFILQCVFSMFAEDIGFLPYGIFTNLVNKVKEGEYNSADLLTQLFKMMDEKDSDRKQESLFKNVRWFNGPLFKIKPEIVLTSIELNLLSQACGFDWSNIKPEIFGVLFESSSEESERHQKGMHYTFEEDILKIIKPCIIDYWEEEFSKCNTQEDFIILHKKLKSYRVLDPACGSGNFLLIAYREIKRIEARIFHRVSTLSGKNYNWCQEFLGYYPVQNMYGIEINKFPSLIARISLWITKKMMQQELLLNEEDLPLEELNHIICSDALVTKWNDVDVVVGNPPFLGYSQIRSAKGDKYFDWLRDRFKGHGQMSDYCTYWYEKVLEDVRPGVRVGLVSTNTVTQTNSRKHSLDKIIEEKSEIFNAISSQVWSGDAKVHVSIVNFINKESFKGTCYLDGKAVEGISSRLKPFERSVNHKEAAKLNSNKNIAFMGVAPMDDGGFILTPENAKKIIAEDKNYKPFIKKYISGDDVNQTVEQKATRYIIDFNDEPLETVIKFKSLYKILKDKVKPFRDNMRRECRRKNWWKHGERAVGMRENIAEIKQFIITARHSKHPVFAMIENKNILPGDSTVVFSSDNFGFLALLNSKFHTEWFKHQCSTLKGDLRYTNSTVFETFPLPDSLNEKLDELGLKLNSLRREICNKNKIGLTSLYNQIAEGAHDGLNKVQQEIDKEIAKVYGFPLRDLSNTNAILGFLYKLNEEKAIKEAVEETQKLRAIAIRKLEQKQRRKLKKEA